MNLEFLVKNIGRKGFGLFAVKDYPEGVQIFDERPYVIFRNENDATPNSVRLYSDIYVDSHSTLISDFINHNCEPNLKYDLMNLKFISIKPIKKGEELCYDYDSTEINLNREGLNFNCYCGSNNCRKEITGNKKND